MILPIRAIGDPVLKRPAKEIEQDSDELQLLIDDMFETMYNAHGIGLAAPQIGKSIRIFVVDTGVAMDEAEEGEVGFKDAIINPEILENGEEEDDFEEGCLSIPNIREDVSRPLEIEVRYLDRHFKEHKRKMDGLLARVFQHELDHLDGVLFTDYLPPLKKRFIKSKIDRIKKGKIEVPYPMRFPGR